MKKFTAMMLATLMFISLVGTAAAYDTVNVIYGVNLRTAPSTDSKVIRMLPRDEEIQIIAKVNAYWMKVKTKNGSIGYISADSKYTDSTREVKEQIKTTGYPYLRSVPSVDHSKVYRSIPKGKVLEVLHKPNSYYVKVSYGGQTGYISTNYIQYLNGTVNNKSAPSSSSSSLADSIIDTAMSLIGRAEYDYGTRDHRNLILDCSSFTEYVFEQHGIDLKWGTRYQKNAGDYVSKSNLKKGDLVFFSVGNSTEIGHVGIYISDGNFINILDKPESDVHIANLNKGYWADHYITARRVID